MNNKQAVLLNYSMMCGEISQVLSEKVDFMSRFFREEPSLNQDADLLQVASAFRAFVTSFKELDDTVDTIGELND